MRSLRKTAEFSMCQVHATTRSAGRGKKPSCFEFTEFPFSNGFPRQLEVIFRNFVDEVDTVSVWLGEITKNVLHSVDLNICNCLPKCRPVHNLRWYGHYTELLGSYSHTFTIIVTIAFVDGVTHRILKGMRTTATSFEAPVSTAPESPHPGATVHLAPDEGNPWSSLSFWIMTLRNIAKR